MPLAPGDVFAGYTIERRLGAGGMGVVYLARHPRLPRSDALKLLSRELSADPDFALRFQREADLAARLVHPNVVSVNDRGEHDGQLWISMQFIDGMDGEAALTAAGGQLPADRAVRIVEEVGVGLDAAHRRGLVHRDVKPANVLLADGDGEDEPERVFLTDFGIAKAMDEAMKLTRTGSVIATLDYASPEQLEGRELDGRADVYSLGCLLYKLLTGSVPFPGNSVAAPIHGHLSVPPPHPTARVPGLPPGLDAVVGRAMAKDRTARFPTCRALSAAARAALASTVTLPGAGLTPTTAPARPTASTPPTAGAVPDGRAPVTTVYGGGSAPAAYATPARYTPAAPDPAGDRGSPPSTRPRRSRGVLVMVLSVVAALVAAGAVTWVLQRGGSDDGPGGAASGARPSTSPTSSTSTVAGPVPGLPSSTPLSGEVMVVTREVAGNTDLYLLDADTDLVTSRLTSAPEIDFAPVISPDRGTLVYFRAGDGTNELRVVAADGSGDRSLFEAVPPECVGDVYQPAWNTVDPTLLALSCGDADGARSLQLVSVTGEVVRTLATPEAVADDLTFSPDGSQLAFWSGADRSAQGGGLHAVPTGDTGSPVQLTDSGPGVDGDPAWSPDGQTIAFRRVVPGGSEIWVMGADGSDQRPLSPGPAAEGDPSWSPDGSRIAFSSDRPGGATSSGAHLWVMDADGSSPTPLLVGDPHPVSFLAWSRR